MGTKRGFRNMPDLGTQMSSEDSFELYVIPELEVLARVALTITRNSADAEDLVQETLLSAYRAIDRFDGTHPRAWLLTIMRNTEKKRHRRRRPNLLRDGDAVERLAFSAPDQVDNSPEQAYIANEFLGVVTSCLVNLPDRHRQVVELIDIDGLSYAEAAEIIGLPIGTVMSRLHRARARIRRSRAPGPRRARQPRG